LGFSNAFTHLPNIREPAWVSPSARELSSAEAAAFGSNPNPGEVRRFTLQCPARDRTSNPSLQPSCILLIEDSQADAGLVREALEQHGVEGELLLIRDGEGAIRYVEAFREQNAACPDLVILDLNLPRRSGREVLECMRDSASFGDATIVIFSSSGAQEDRSLAVGFRVSRYIRKPLRLAEFLSLGAVFKAILDESRSSR